MRTYNILVKGRVQGVFLRENTKKKAIELDIKGSVNNLPGGDVEILAQGYDKNILAFVQWCRFGPEYAKVDEIKVKKSDEQEFDGFEISY